MRYMLAMLLAVGIGIATLVPPALAFTVDSDGNYVNQYGNRVVPYMHGNGTGSICNVDGAAIPCD